MEVFQKGLEFYGSLITGPTHNYLSITFGVGPRTPIEYVETVKSRQGHNNEAIVSEIMDEHASDFPINGNYYPHEVRFRSDDTPSKACYARMIRVIIQHAGTNLQD